MADREISYALRIIEGCPEILRHHDTQRLWKSLISLDATHPTKLPYSELVKLQKLAAGARQRYGQETQFCVGDKLRLEAGYRGVLAHISTEHNPMMHHSVYGVIVDGVPHIRIFYVAPHGEPPDLDHTHQWVIANQELVDKTGMAQQWCGAILMRAYEWGFRSRWIRECDWTGVAT